MVCSFVHLFWYAEKDVVKGENNKAALPLERSPTFLFFVFQNRRPKKVSGELSLSFPNVLLIHLDVLNRTIDR